MSTTMITADATADHAAPGTPQPPQRKRSRLRRAVRVTRTVFVVLLLLAGAVLGGGYLVRERLAGQAFLKAGTAVLSAQPIAVGSADAGVVSRALVAERQTVATGDELAKVTLTADGTGKPQERVLRAPQAGVVTQILPPGQVARPGEPVATLYDPSKLVFSVDVPLETLRQLRLGMRAYVTGPGVPGRLTTTIASVEPRVDGAAGPGDGLTVVLRPDPGTLATVRTLVPGLQFAVIVDTTTAPGGTPAVNSA